jgi:hypothetical protein
MARRSLLSGNLESSSAGEPVDAPERRTGHVPRSISSGRRRVMPAVSMCDGQGDLIAKQPASRVRAARRCPGNKQPAVLVELVCNPST